MAQRPNWDMHFSRHVGPMAVARGCNYCKFVIVTKRAMPGRNNIGRGYGMVVGNQARGQMIQHIKATHPEVKP